MYFLLDEINLLFTFQVLLPKFIISPLLIYSSFRVWYVVASDKGLQTSSIVSNFKNAFLKFILV